MQTLLYMVKNLSLNKEKFPLILIPEKVINCANNETYNARNLSDELIMREFKLKSPSLVSEPRKPNLIHNLQFEYKQVRIKRIKYTRFILVFIGSNYLIFPLLILLTPFFIQSIYLSIIISLVIAIKTSIESDFVNKKVPISEITLTRFLEHNKNEEREYKKRQSEYELEKREYQRKQEEFKNKLTYYKNNYHLIKYHEAIKPIAYPIRTEETINKGNSEFFFLNKLINYFGNEIKIDMKLGIYFPDFVYECQNPQFFIDIEIDEDYDYINKKPIHYVGADDERNNYFLSKNWFVIRFAEQQIIDYPDDCCNYLKDVIKVLKDPLHNNDPRINTIPKIKCWTYEEAVILGKSLKRTYIH